MRLKSNP